jgi:hypothetical protein
VPRLELHRRLVRGDEPELRPLPDPR